MVYLSSSFGNDSCALIQWAIENDIEFEVVYINTGWASDEWQNRVENMINIFDIKTTILKPDMGFEDLIKFKKGFPNQRFQWCTAFLKGIPFLNYLDEVDPELKSITMIGKRRDESEERKNTPSMILSDYHGGQIVNASII